MSANYTYLESGQPDSILQPDVFVGSMFTHNPGERIRIFEGQVGASSLALTVSSTPEPGVFLIDKSPRPTDRHLAEAQEWALETPIVRLGPSADARAMTGLLLVPSVVGLGLFGARQALPEVGDRFGTISLVRDGGDKTHLLQIEMPYTPHPALGRLVIARETP